MMPHDIGLYQSLNQQESVPIPKCTQHRVRYSWRWGDRYECPSERDALCRSVILSAVWLFDRRVESGRLLHLLLTLAGCATLDPSELLPCSCLGVLMPCLLQIPALLLPWPLGRSARAKGLRGLFSFSGIYFGQNGDHENELAVLGAQGCCRGTRSKIRGSDSPTCP